MKKFKDTINFNRCIGSGSPVFFSSNMRSGTVDGMDFGYSLSNLKVRTASSTTANLATIKSFAQYGSESTAGAPYRTCALLALAKSCLSPLRPSPLRPVFVFAGIP